MVSGSYVFFCLLHVDAWRGGWRWKAGMERLAHSRYADHAQTPYMDEGGCLVTRRVNTRRVNLAHRTPAARTFVLSCHVPSLSEAVVSPDRQICMQASPDALLRPVHHAPQLFRRIAFRRANLPLVGSINQLVLCSAIALCHALLPRIRQASEPSGAFARRHRGGVWVAQQVGAAIRFGVA